MGKEEEEGGWRLFGSQVTVRGVVQGNLGRSASPFFKKGLVKEPCFLVLLIPPPSTTTAGTTYGNGQIQSEKFDFAQTKITVCETLLGPVRKWAFKVGIQQIVMESSRYFW